MTKKATNPSDRDRHKPSKQIRIPRRLADLLDELAERNFSSAAQEAVIAIREHLQRQGMIPGEADKP